MSPVVTSWSTPTAAHIIPQECNHYCGIVFVTYVTFLSVIYFLAKSAPLFSSSAHRADTKPWSRSYEGVTTLKQITKTYLFYLLFLLCLVTKGRLKFARPLSFLWLGGGQRRWADAWLRDATKTKSQQCSRRTACKHDMKLFTLIFFSKKWIKRIMKNNLRVTCVFASCEFWKENSHELAKSGSHMWATS